MKRRQHQELHEDPHITRKRFAKLSSTLETVPFSRCLLKHWQLTEEAAQYLSNKNKVEENVMCDKTNPQLALVVYTPNMFQKIIDEIWEHSVAISLKLEPMDI